MLCKALQVQAQWNSAIQNFQNHLKQIHTDAQIVQALIDGLGKWYDGENPTAPTAEPRVKEAILQQEDIRWGPGLRGFLSHQWVYIQQQFILSNN